MDLGDLGKLGTTGEEGAGMNEAYNVIDKYILPFLNFIKKIINSIVKLFGRPTVFAED